MMLITIAEMGLIYALVTVSVWLTSVLLKYDDISIEATFCLGGALTARLLVLGCPVLMTPLAAVVSGAVIGLITGLLHLFLKLNNLITGIIVLSGLFSVNLLVGSANISLVQFGNCFEYLPVIPGLTNTVVGLAFIVFFVVLFIKWLLTTELGLLLRATGHNKLFISRLGKSTVFYILLIFMLAHSIGALAGTLFVQYTGFFSIWSGAGILIIALASLMIARLLSKEFGVQLIAGAVIYQAIITLSLTMHSWPELNKLITALLLVFLMLMQKSTQEIS
jgi:putative tryptophan/tyrosine transport system permease protein